MRHMLETKAGDGAHVIRDKSMATSWERVRPQRASGTGNPGVPEVTCR
jgi:hypothetical protein